MVLIGASQASVHSPVTQRACDKGTCSEIHSAERCNPYDLPGDTSDWCAACVWRAGNLTGIAGKSHLFLDFLPSGEWCGLLEVLTCRFVGWLLGRRVILSTKQYSWLALKSTVWAGGPQATGPPCGLSHLPGPLWEPHLRTALPRARWNWRPHSPPSHSLHLAPPTVSSLEE